MEPRQYLAALRRRSLWLVAFAILGVLGSVVLTKLTAPAYDSTIKLYFSGTGGDPAEVYQGTRYVQRLLASYRQLATSPLVLDPVISELDLQTTASSLAGDVTAVNPDDTVVLIITVRAASAAGATAIAEEVGRQLDGAVDSLSPGGPDAGAVTVTTVSPATEPRFQAAPNAKENAALGGAVGLALGVLAVMVRELSGPRVRNRAVLERITGYPVLGSIRRARHWRRRPPGQDDPRGPSDGDLGGVTSDDFQRLRLSLDLATAHALPHTILVATSSEREDSTFVATGMARALAATGARVAVITVRPEDVDGSSSTNVAAGKELNHVFLDGGALTSAEDAERLARNADAVVMVVDVRRAHGHRVQRMLSIVQSQRAELLGLVLNNDHRVSTGWISRARRLLFGNQAVRTSAADSQSSVVPLSSQVTAAAGLFLVGLNYQLPFVTTSALVAGVGLAPVWLPALGHFRHARLLFGMAAIALVCGVLLAGASLPDHDIDPRIAIEQSTVFVAMLGGVGLVLWARTVIPIRTIAISFGVGMLADGVLDSVASANPWKYQLSVPVTIIVLAWLMDRRGHFFTALALIGLGTVGIAFESRSYFGFCAVAAAGLLWQARPAKATTGSRAYSLLILLAVTTGVYFLGSSLLVSGVLGEGLQERSTKQIQESGSLIAGGRPEWFATIELMSERPEGFGLGVVPTNGDVYTAKTGLADIGIPSSNGYVDNYMFGGQIKLHSVVADLWATYGPAGFLFGIGLMVLLVTRLSDELGRRTASGLLLFLCLNGLWDLAFGPLYSAATSLALTVGLVLSYQPTSRLRSSGAATAAPTSSRPAAVQGAR